MATFLRVLFLLYIVPTIFSLACITSVMFNRYKNKLYSRFAFLDVAKPSRKFINRMAVCPTVVTLAVLSVLSTVPGIIARFGIENGLEKDNYYEFLRTVLQCTTCAVLSGCSAIAVMLGFLVDETENSDCCTRKHQATLKMTTLK